MPNWTTNTLTIKGLESEVMRFLQNAENKKAGSESAFSLEKLVPMPLCVEDWYQWRIDNWGTKWDINECSWDHYESAGQYEATIFFNSAWSPPAEAIKTMSEEYKLEFELFSTDPAMCWAYHLLINDSGIVEEEASGSGQYDYDSPEGREFTDRAGLDPDEIFLEDEEDEEDEESRELYLAAFNEMFSELNNISSERKKD